MEQEKWIKTTIHLGRVKEGSKTKFTYNYMGIEPKDVVNIVPGCGGCTKVVSFIDNILSVEFDAGSIPKHLKESFKDGLPTSKSIVVEYSDGVKEKLGFTAIIER